MQRQLEDQWKWLFRILKWNWNPECVEVIGRTVSVSLSSHSRLLKGKHVGRINHSSTNPTDLILWKIILLFSKWNPTYKPGTKISSKHNINFTKSTDQNALAFSKLIIHIGDYNILTNIFFPELWQYSTTKAEDPYSHGKVVFFHFSEISKLYTILETF